MLVLDQHHEVAVAGDPPARSRSSMEAGRLALQAEGGAPGKGSGSGWHYIQSSRIKQLEQLLEGDSQAHPWMEIRDMLCADQQHRRSPAPPSGGL